MGDDSTTQGYLHVTLPGLEEMVLPATSKLCENRVVQAFRDVSTDKQSWKMRVAQWYFRPGACESESLYRALGVHLFGKTLVCAVEAGRESIVHDGANKPLAGNSLEGYANLYANTIRSEGAHLLWSLAFSAAGVALAYGGYTEASIGVNVANLFVNNYPMMLQREHRLRLKRVIQHKTKNVALPARVACTSEVNP